MQCIASQMAIVRQVLKALQLGFHMSPMSPEPGVVLLLLLLEVPMSLIPVLAPDNLEQPPMDAVALEFLRHGEQDPIY